MELHQKYRITQELDSNNRRKFGRIFLGESKENDRLVVIKSVQFDNENVPLQQLRNESNFTFNTFGLPTILDYHEADGEAILVKEYVNGITIQEAFKRKRKKEKLNLLKEVLPQITHLLISLKENNIVHCDIKPGNIIIDKNRQAHLIDFGLALDLKNLPNRKILFPLGFAAPELLLNYLHLVDSRTDQYALGTTIWSLFAEDVPHRHANPSIMTNLQLNLPIPEHDKIPKKLHRVLSKMCSKHQFSLPPNKMKASEVENSLIEGMNHRYDDIQEANTLIQEIKLGLFK